MKAVLQVGPAQFMVEGATFHLLCADIAQTLRAIVALDENEISLTLHTDALERCLADDAQRLAAVGLTPPRTLAPVDADVSTPSATSPSRSPSAELPRHRRPLPVRCVHEPPNIFSPDSFDAAEAVVQELQARVQEQCLLLAKHDVQARTGADADASSSAPRRVVPLPLLRLETYLSTSADVQPEYTAEGRRRRSSLTVLGGDVLP